MDKAKTQPPFGLYVATPNELLKTGVMGDSEIADNTFFKNEGDGKVCFGHLNGMIKPDGYSRLSTDETIPPHIWFKRLQALFPDAEVVGEASSMTEQSMAPLFDPDTGVLIEFTGQHGRMTFHVNRAIFMNNKRLRQKISNLIKRIITATERPEGMSDDEWDYYLGNPVVICGMCHGTGFMDDKDDYPCPQCD